jgi:cyanate permease
MERKWHVAIPLLIAALGIGGAGLLGDPVLKMLSLSIGAFGVFACLPVIWTLPAAFLSGASAAAGIAVINSLGNLSGFVGPYAMGWLRDATGNFNAGLFLIAGLAVVAMITVLSLRHNETLEQVPGHAPAE